MSDGRSADGPLEAPPLSTASAVRHLAAAEAAQGRRVEITGVILLFAENTPALVLLDETDGLFVQTQRISNARLRRGDRITVSGRTAPGDFAPIVIAESVRNQGATPLPEPTPTTLAEIATGGFDAKWVEVEGIVRDAQVVPRLTDRSRKTTVILLAWAETRLRVRVHAELSVADLIDARIRVRGVCFNLHTSNRQFVSASLQCSGSDSVRVLAGTSGGSLCAAPATSG
jgi:hypothetical protein